MGKSSATQSTGTAAVMQGKKPLDLSPLLEFLGCETPDAWVEVALKNQSTLLIDHANCEKKAASTALSLLYRYVDKGDLLRKLSKLAREELRHFEQVIAIMNVRGIDYKHISPSGYAAGLHQHIRRAEPDKLVDTLIVGAFIEARSCERFARLAPHLDSELCSFYLSLLKSESRHFKDYLKLARYYYDSAKQSAEGCLSAEGSSDAEVSSNAEGSNHTKGAFDSRVDFFRGVEAQLIQQQDALFRFHSGVPAS